LLTLWHPAGLGDFREKNTRSHAALRAASLTKNPQPPTKNFFLSAD